MGQVSQTETGSFLLALNFGKCSINLLDHVDLLLKMAMLRLNVDVRHSSCCGQHRK